MKARVKRRRKASNKKTINNTIDFLSDDHSRTLFPLETNRILAIQSEASLRSHISKCLDEKEKPFSFLPQQRVYAAKAERHLRRTVKLDPVSEFFIYDVVYRNRGLFRKPFSEKRAHFGYRFEDGLMLNPSQSYRGFKGAISEYSKTFDHFISFDVASYFNGVYHHDVVNWFRDAGASTEDVDGLGQVLREINVGRSIDFLPQGLYPAKMIGNDFLRFVDNHYALKSDRLIRFMDDFYIFGDSLSDLEHDFVLIQELLGSRGLSVNPNKTATDVSGHTATEKEIDDVKARLLERRRMVISAGYGDSQEQTEVIFEDPLEEDEMEYISEILSSGHLEEDDAELILAVMQENTDQVEEVLPSIARDFPNLAKNVHSFCRGVEDKEVVFRVISESLLEVDRPLEYQLFWYGKILQDYLMDSGYAADVIAMLMGNSAATNVSKAKILEIADPRFGLNEEREKYIRAGSSDWLAWSSAIGSLALDKGSRNHLLKYFGNGSQMNHLIASAVLEMPRIERSK